MSAALVVRASHGFHEHAVRINFILAARRIAFSFLVLVCLLIVVIRARLLYDDVDLFLALILILAT